jgi:hypothetical protein
MRLKCEVHPDSLLDLCFPKLQTFWTVLPWALWRRSKPEDALVKDKQAECPDLCRCHTWRVSWPCSLAHKLSVSTDVVKLIKSRKIDSGETRSTHLGMKTLYEILIGKTDISEGLDVISSSTRDAEDRSWYVMTIMNEIWWKY